MDVDTFGYYRKAANDYFEFGDLSYGILDNPLYGEFLFLKDNQTANTKWNSAQFTGDYTDNMGNTGPVTLRWEMTVMQQNVTVAVVSSTGTVNYTNVIEIKQEIQQFFNNVWTPIAYFSNFYARDKGLVKQELRDGAGGIITFSEARRIVIF